MNRKVLWVDDEIDLLKSHIIFLEKKGYDITPVNNGEDAIALVKDQMFDAVLLDEMMPGLDGLTVLAEIKTYDPGIPVVMITKSEEEHIMDEALGSRISDYLIKPVNPNQIFTTLKRLLETKTLRGERISREYARQANQNRMALAMGLDYDGWAQVHTSLSSWDYRDRTIQRSGTVADTRRSEKGISQRIHEIYREELPRLAPQWRADAVAPGARTVM